MTEADKYFAPFKSAPWYTGISLLALIYWVCLSVRLALKLKNAPCPKGGTCVPSKYFWPFFGIVVLYPLAYFAREIYIGISQRNLKDRPSNLSPYYGFCLTRTIDTNRYALSKGAVAHLDYACLAEQRRFNREHADLLTTRAYMVTYSLFALLLFLQSGSVAGKIGSLLSAITPFRTEGLRHALLMALLIISAPALSGSYYLSGIALYFYSQCLQIMGALVVLMLSHILYQVTYITT